MLSHTILKSIISSDQTKLFKASISHDSEFNITCCHKYTKAKGILKQLFILCCTCPDSLQMSDNCQEPWVIKKETSEAIYNLNEIITTDPETNKRSILVLKILLYLYGTYFKLWTVKIIVMRQMFDLQGRCQA